MYSWTSLNPYLSVDTLGYALWGAMGWERFAEKESQKSWKNHRKYLGLLPHAKLCYQYMCRLVWGILSIISERNQLKQFFSYSWPLQAWFAYWTSPRVLQVCRQWGGFKSSAYLLTASKMSCGVGWGLMGVSSSLTSSLYTDFFLANLHCIHELRKTFLKELQVV